MALKMIAAFLLAFGFTAVSGKFLIPWLKEHGFAQPLKDKVEEKIYNDREEEENK